MNAFTTLKKIAILSIMAHIFLGSVTLSGAQEGGVEPKRVLVIYSYHEGLPWERIIDDNMRATFAAKATGPIELNVEHADRVRHPGNVYLQNFIDLLQHKYSHKKMDVVIGIDDEATDILLKYGNKLFPGITMIFVTAERKTLHRNSLKPNMTSLLWGVNIKGSIDIIYKLLPETRQILVITGISLSDRTMQHMVRKEMRDYPKRDDISYLEEMTIENLLDKVARLPERSAIFYMGFSQDSEGKNFVPLEILSTISQKANMPTFGLVDTYIGRGIVGGLLLSAELQGRRCAKICLRILNGESPVDIAPGQTHNITMFDERQLKRWSINEEKLPPDSIVRYREFSIWRQYRWQSIGLILIGLTLTLIIIFLWIQWTKRKNAEEKTHESEVKYRTVADYTYDWEYWTNIDGTLNYVSPSCERISSYTVQEFIDSPSLFREIIVPEDRGLWDEHYCNSREELRERELEFRIQRRDGEIRWIEHACQPVYNDQGNSLGLRASNRDITERKKAEQAMRESEIWTRNIFKSLEEAVLVVAPDKKIKNMNEAAKRIFGYSADELVNLSAEVLHVDFEHYVKFVRLIEGAFDRDETANFEFKLKRKNGEVFPTEHTVSLLKSDAGEAIGIVSVVRDISERKQMEKKAQSLRNELAHISRVSTINALTATIAHEINQPLAAILSNAQAALRFLNHENPDLDQVRAALLDISWDDKRAAEVIRRLRNMLKKEEPVYDPFDINVVIEKAIQLANSEIIFHNILVTKDLKPGIPVIYGDPIQIQQVIINLLLNAMDAIKDRPADARHVLLSTCLDRDKGVSVTITD